MLGQGQDGRPFYQPATLKAFEEALWKRRGQAPEGKANQQAGRLWVVEGRGGSWAAQAELSRGLNICSGWLLPRQDAEGLCWQRAPHRPKTRLEAQGAES